MSYRNGKYRRKVITTDFGNLLNLTVCLAVAQNGDSNLKILSGTVIVRPAATFSLSEIPCTVFLTS